MPSYRLLAEYHRLFSRSFGYPGMSGKRRRSVFSRRWITISLIQPDLDGVTVKYRFTTSPGTAALMNSGLWLYKSEPGRPAEMEIDNAGTNQRRWLRGANHEPST